MYQESDGHVLVLAASIRKIEHLMASISFGANIVTCPFKILKEWADKGMPMPNESFKYEAGNLTPIPYKQLDLSRQYSEFKYNHVLIDRGLMLFAEDWNKLAGKSAIQ